MASSGFDNGLSRNRQLMRIYKIIATIVLFSVLVVTVNALPSYQWFKFTDMKCDSDLISHCHMRQNIFKLTSAQFLTTFAFVISTYAIGRTEKASRYIIFMLMSILVIFFFLYTSEFVANIYMVMVPYLASLWLMYQGLSVIYIAHFIHSTNLRRNSTMVTVPGQEIVSTGTFDGRLYSFATLLGTMALLGCVYEIKLLFPHAGGYLVLLFDMAFWFNVAFAILSLLPQFNKGLVTLNFAIIYQLMMLAQTAQFVTQSNNQIVVFVVNVSQYFILIFVLAYTAGADRNPLTGLFREIANNFITKHGARKLCIKTNRKTKTTTAGVEYDSKDGSDAEDEEMGAEQLPDEQSPINSPRKRGRTPFDAITSGGSSNGEKNYTDEVSPGAFCGDDHSGGLSDFEEEECEEDHDCSAGLPQSDSESAALMRSSRSAGSQQSVQDLAVSVNWDVESQIQSGGVSSSSHRSNNRAKRGSDLSATSPLRLFTEKSVSFHVCLLLLVCYLPMLLTAWGASDGSPSPLIFVDHDPFSPHVMTRRQVAYSNNMFILHIVTGLVSVWVVYALSLYSSYMFYHKYHVRRRGLYLERLSLNDPTSRRHALMREEDKDVDSRCIPAI